MACFRTGCGPQIEVYDLDRWEESWTIVPVSDDATAMFTVGGKMLFPTREAVRGLVWCVENDDGTIELMTRQEFLERVSSQP